MIYGSFHSSAKDYSGSCTRRRSTGPWRTYPPIGALSWTLSDGTPIDCEWIMMQKVVPSLFSTLHVIKQNLRHQYAYFKERLQVDIPKIRYPTRCYCEMYMCLGLDVHSVQRCYCEMCLGFDVHSVPRCYCEMCFGLDVYSEWRPSKNINECYAKYSYNHHLIHIVLKLVYIIWFVDRIYE